MNKVQIEYETICNLLTQQRNLLTIKKNKRIYFDNFTEN